jgi:hypothetical protein
MLIDLRKNDQQTAESQLENQAVDWLLTRMKRHDLKPLVRKHSRSETEQDWMTFNSFHHYLPDFPVYFDVAHVTNLRKKVTFARMLTRFGDSPIAKQYFHMLRDYRHLSKAGVGLALVFSCPDLPTSVDRISRKREANSVKAAVLHADLYDEEDTPGARFVWRADRSSLPAYVKLDPPVLVVEPLSSYYRRILAQMD